MVFTVEADVVVATVSGVVCWTEVLWAVVTVCGVKLEELWAVVNFITADLKVGLMLVTVETIKKVKLR